MPSGVLVGHSPETFSPSAVVMARSVCGRRELERDGNVSVISRARLMIRCSFKRSKNVMMAQMCCRHTMYAFAVKTRQINGQIDHRTPMCSG